MKRVIKNQKKMKNTMYIVFGVFALALFIITRTNTSYANDGLNIDRTLDAIVLYGTVETEADEEDLRENDEEDFDEEDDENHDKNQDEEQGNEEGGDEEQDEQEEQEQGDEQQGDDESGLDDEQIGTGIDELNNNMQDDSDDNDEIGSEPGEDMSDENKNLVDAGDIVEGSKVEEPEIILDDEISQSSEKTDKNIEGMSDNVVVEGKEDYELLTTLVDEIQNENIEIMSTTKTVTYHPNGGAFSGMGVNETKNFTYNYSGSEIIPIYNIQIPDRISNDMSQQSGWMFAGRYTKDGTNDDWGEEFDISNPQTTTAYAKWLPFNDYTVNLVGTTITLMDRDLGAESNRSENYEKSEGLYYQWGNNYGFTKNIIYSGTEQIEGITNSGEGNQYYSNKFIKGGNNWIKNPELNTWGTEDYLALDEEKQGPCPRGYHIPNNYEFYAAADLVLRQRVISDVNYTYCGPNPDNNCIMMKLNLRPRGSINNEGIYESFNGGFRTSTHDIINNKYYVSIGHNVTETTQSNAKNIRCFKNNNTTNELKINITNDNIETKNLRRREPIENYLKDLERIGYTLSGWFYDEKYDEEVDLNEKIHETKRIYVKWNKNPRYTFFGNGGNIDGLKEKTIKYSFKYYNGNLSSKSSYGGKKIEGAKNLKVTLKKTDDRGNYHTLYIYNYIKTSNEITNDYIMSGKVGDIVDKLIEGDTIGFIIQQSGPPINMEIDINAYLGTESDEHISNIYKVGYSFSGWYEGITGENNELIISNKEFDFDNEPVTQDRTFYAKWNPNKYTIQLDSNGGNSPQTEIDATYGEEIVLPNATRDGYVFKGWKDENGNLYVSKIGEDESLTTEDGVIVTLTAQWEENKSNDSGSSSGGGKRVPSSDQDHGAADKKTDDKKSENMVNDADKTDNQQKNISDNDENKSDKSDKSDISENIESQTDISSENQVQYTNEQKESYSFAKSNGITTTSSIKEAKMNTSLKRIEMAKMLSYYAINVLGQEPDTSKGIVKFNDVSNKMDKQYDNGVTLSYQLGIMGQNMPKNKFRPNDEVTRAEFVTALSRMVYNTQDGKGNVKYYEPHMAKLYNEGIISNTNPKMKEKRGYVMTMLMRSAK